jgi:hypothetical protein
MNWIKAILQVFTYLFVIAVSLSDKLELLVRSSLPHILLTWQQLCNDRIVTRTEKDISLHSKLPDHHVRL